MGMENLFGKKEKNILVIIKKIKKMVLVFFIGLMKNSFVVFGKMENKMVLENILKGILLSMEFFQNTYFAKHWIS